jgi:hypothetical protein
LNRWTIAPDKRDNARQDDKNGSRRYQVMLKSMKLLPDASITAADFISQSKEIKGKRKATEEPEGSRSSKKKLIEYDDEDEDEDDRSEAGERDNHAMQVTDD